MTDAIQQPVVLWWSRGGRDYSRDRIVRLAFGSLGWKIVDFRPAVSQLGHVEAGLRRIAAPDLVWVPCFRQRDATAAQKWASRCGVPVVCDPLISAWDKQVFERRKFPEISVAARRLLRWEGELFRRSDVVVADTKAHADFFHDAHGVARSQLAVIPVSAEESFFAPQPVRENRRRIRALFYGSFIGLQGPQFIAAAAQQVSDVDWTFIGSGPLLDECRQIAGDCSHVKFVSRVPYETLPAEIGKADVLLGVFGTSAKAGRVIPNKVYQALASALNMAPNNRKVVLSDSGNFPTDLYMAQGLLKTMDNGHELRIVDPEAVGAALTDEIAVLMLTHVDYRTGRMHDMDALTQKAQYFGRLLA